MKHLKKWLVLAAAVLLLSCTACGDGGSGDEEIPAEPVTTAEYMSSTEEGLLHFWFFSNQERTAARNVKWGDCTLVQLPDGEHLLIDAADEGYEGEIVQIVKDAGITKIKTAIISHFHQDHYGGLKNFAKTFGIETVYINAIELDETLAWNTNASPMKIYVAELRNMGLEVIPVLAGDTITLGEVTIDVLYPAADTTSSTTNDSSMVCTVNWRGQRAVFAADLYYAGESCALREIEDLTALQGDLLKIMHHGADTSGSAEFITAVSPQVAVCMGNHILNNLANGRYAKVGCTPYETWRDGDVCVTFTGTELRVWASNLQQANEG